MSTDWILCRSGKSRNNYKGFFFTDMDIKYSVVRIYRESRNSLVFRHLLIPCPNAHNVFLLKIILMASATDNFCFCLDIEIFYENKKNS